MDWSSLLSTTRLGQEHENTKHADLDRTQFQRDYDRIIFSSPFRRLQNKTQVFPLPGSVFVHNRLTHSLEVASVGRSLGNIVATKVIEKGEKSPLIHELGTIVSTACLAHDLGNPPFGHAGEDAISYFFKHGKGTELKDKVTEAEWADLVNFEGNANALRVLSHKFKGRLSGGYGLTYSTLASFVKYPCNSTLGGNKQSVHRKKYGYFQSEKVTFEKIAAKLNLVKDDEGAYKRHPLVYLVEAADDICYNIIDLEDAHRLGILSFEETSRLLLSLFKHLGNDQKNRIEHFLSDLNQDKNEQLGYMRAKAINLLISECSEAFLKNYDSIMNGTFNQNLLDCIAPELLIAIKDIKVISYEKIYKHRSVVEIEIAGYKVLGGLLEEFVEASLRPNSSVSKNLLSLIPLQYKSDSDSVYTQTQTILDFISGMTDLYAVDLYKKIKGISLANT